MKLEFKLTLVTQQQLQILSPLKDHSDIIKNINNFELINKDLKEGIYVGYFILDDIFNIMTVIEAHDINDATKTVLEHIFNQLKINTVVESKLPDLPKLSKINNINSQ